MARFPPTSHTHFTSRQNFNRKHKFIGKFVCLNQRADNFTCQPLVVWSQKQFTDGTCNNTQVYLKIVGRENMRCQVHFHAISGEFAREFHAFLTIRADEITRRNRENFEVKADNFPFFQKPCSDFYRLWQVNT